MRFKVDDLRKAIEWVANNSKDVTIAIREKDDYAVISCSDKYGQLVEIKLHNEGRMSPKIVKEEPL